jgi:hypothetical protein
MQKDIWHYIAKFARLAPSPHNTQPFRLKRQSKLSCTVVFLPRRGLYFGDPQGRFTWLAAGVFIEICKIVAHNQAYELDIEWHFTSMYPNGDYQSPQTLATLTLRTITKPVSDFDPELIAKRQTSRLPYNDKICPPQVISEMQAEATRHGHSFEVRSDPESIGWVVELNKQALFHDLDNQGARKELIEWLRFNEREEYLKRDGLSARCMALSGPLLRNFFLHHRFWRLPIIRSITGVAYKSTMKGVGTIGWLRGPYITMEDWVHSGSVMFRLWLILTKHGFYWHPYGSVITSEDARLNMIHYLNLPEEVGGENMVWLLLRLGHSEKPPQSLRLPIEELFL